MLTLLKIRNLALVEELEWDVGSGLVGVTGETGAGKSVIIGALRLILGERADRSLIRTGEESCTVEANFRVTNEADVNEYLGEHGFELCEEGELVIKRVIGGGGGNRQFVNCSPATLSVLKGLGNMLVDLHGPHDHQSLLSQDRQLAMLDSYAGAEAEVAGYREAWRIWGGLVEEREDLMNAERASARELDLLKFQVEEIDGAGLKPGEDEALEAQYRVSANATRLMELSRGIVGHLSGGGGSVLDRLTDISRDLNELERLDGATGELGAGFEGARVELDELASGLAAYAAGLELDPGELAELERRVDLIESLKRKYGNTVDEVLAFGEEARGKLEKIENREGELARLEAEVLTARGVLEDAGGVLGGKRRDAAPRLARDVADHLQALGFKQSVFSIELESMSEPGGRGFETVDFLFGPNPGEPTKPLRIIASSGEMSRVMLAVKSALAEQDPIPLMVFDEIDANVGGEVAHAVGAKMAALGERHQVVSITHLPQVAAAAHCHYVVRKEVKSSRTRSFLDEVTGDLRVGELARMLGGTGESERALAEAMLAGVASR
ncbi:MAG: DNA repair protein RecN [Verrucomicrobiota bacterium]